MAVRVETHAEPIPGYRLMERLGGGGFGEVWKCEAPGGLLKAIKFVFGNLELAGDSGHRAEQELKALTRVKSVRHPYILSLERFDIIDGQLVIVMELADRNLWDRYKECRNQGFQGIPREELLGYMFESAEALDLMNIHYQLQHLDIKPQNLFLVHSHIKVADFGLVKDLEGTQASVTGGITPVYAAPETFDGVVSRYSDQYSLAIVFQELLTGQRPFAGINVRQLIMQHLSAEPNLSSLDEADRVVIRRALSKSPDDRFPTCSDMVRELEAASGQSKTTSAPAGRPLPTEEPPQSALRMPPLTDPAPLRGSEEWTPPDSRLLVAEARADAGLDGAPAEPGSARRPRPSSYHVRGKARESEAQTRWMRAGDDPRTTSGPPQVEPEGDGLLFPALVIGVGGLGASVLSSLRACLGERFGSAENAKHIRLLLLDTDPEVQRSAPTAGVARRGGLTPAEVLVTPLSRPSHYLKPTGGRLPVDGWLPQKLLYRIPRQQRTLGVRALGRLAFCDHYKTIRRRLQMELEAIRDPRPLERAVKMSGLGVRFTRPRIYVVAGLMGGTGSGMVLDLTYTVRHLLRTLGETTLDITGLLLLPHMDARGSSHSRQGAQSERVEGGSVESGKTPELSHSPPSHSPPSHSRTLSALGNTCAALTELHHFGGPGTTFQARYLEREPPVSDPDPPFTRTFLLSIPEAGKKKLGDEVVGMAGRFLAGDLASELGRVGDRGRVAQTMVPRGQRGQYYQTFGLYRLTFPRRQVIRRTAGICLRQIVQGWSSKDGGALEEPVREYVQAAWRGQELSAEHFIARVQEACEARLGKAPEAASAQALEELAQRVAASKGAGKGAPALLHPGDVAEVLERLEQLLGRPEAPEDAAGVSAAAAPPPLVGALAEAATAIANEWSQKLAELPVRLIERPGMRLAGAEQAVRQVVAAIQQVIDRHEPLARDLTDKAVQAYVRLQALLAQADDDARSWPRRGSATPADIVELLRCYAKWRYQSLVLRHVAGVYVSMRGHLTDELREINFCRVRLGDLLAQLEDEEDRMPKAEEGEKPAPASPARDPVLEGRGRYLFPEGCFDIPGAVEQQLARIGPGELLELDARLQKTIKAQFVALVQVCLSSANVTRNLARALWTVAEDFVAERLPETDVAGLLLGSGSEEDQQAAADEVVALFEEAVPEVTRNPRSHSPYPRAEVTILAASSPEQGEVLAGMARAALQGSELYTAIADDGLVFYREWTNLALVDLEQLGPLAAMAYRQMRIEGSLTPHARVDIPFSLPD